MAAFPEVTMNSQQQPEMLKIVVETIDKEDACRVFHTNFELTSLVGQQVSRYEVPEEAEWSPLTIEAAQLPGVEQVLLRPYGLATHRATAFEWEVISPAVK